MANFFDRFDAAPDAAPARSGSGNFFDQFDAAPFDERFQGDASQAAPNPQLKAELQRVARAKTTGPRQSGPLEGMAIDFMNQGSAASQRTTPSVESHYPNIVSADVHQDDAGRILYRDSAGQMLPVDDAQHVVLRDPSDQRYKVFRRTEDTDEGTLAAAGRVLMTGMGAGAPTARPGLTTTPRAAMVPRASETAATAKPYYREFDEAAKRSFVEPSTVVNRVSNAMVAAKQPRHLAEEVHTTVESLRGRPPPGPTQLQRLEAEMNGLPVPAREPETAVSLARLRDLKEEVGASFKSPDKRVRTAAGAASREINQIIGDADPAAGASLRTADAITSASKAQEKLEQLEKIAGLRTGRAGYGGNAVNNMRQVLTPIVQKAIEGRKTGFKPDEIAAINEIVQGTTATNAARFVGQLSPSKGAIQTGLAFGTAGATAALGAAANKLATILTANQITRLREMVAKRSPAYEAAVSKAVQRFEDAQAAFASNPSSARFAGYISASRALSNGLTRDGIQITSGDLIRSMQGPMRSAADDENPEAPGGLNQ